MATSQISSAPYLLSDANQAAYRYNGEVPPEEALEQQALNRRQHIANLLIQRGLQPRQGQMAGRFYVAPSPVQHLADLASIAAGVYGTHRNDQARGELASKSQQDVAEAMARYQQGSSDVPAVPASAPVAAPQPAMAAAMASQPRPSMDAQPVDDPGSPSVFQGGYQMGADESGWAPKGPIQDLNGAPPAPQQQVAEAMAQQTQGPVSPGTPGRARTPEEKQAVLAELLAHQNPRVRQMASFLASQEERMDNRKLLHEEKQSAQTSRDETNKLLLDQKGEQMKQTLEIGKMQIQALDARGQDTAELKRDMQNKELAFEKWKTQQDLSSRKELAGMKGAGKGAAMSATAQKELFEADDTIASSKNVVRALDRAMELNPKAFEGGTASARAKGLGYVPGKFPDADATVELNNIVSGQALEQLRAIFGGMPTEGERKILMEIQGSVDLKAPQRQAIYERAKEAAQRRLDSSQQKAKQLREGTYFSDQGGQDVQAAPPVPTTNGKPNAFQPFHDPNEEEAYQKWKLEHK